MGMATIITMEVIMTAIMMEEVITMEGAMTEGAMILMEEDTTILTFSPTSVPWWTIIGLILT